MHGRKEVLLLAYADRASSCVYSYLPVILEIITLLLFLRLNVRPSSQSQVPTLPWGSGLVAHLSQGWGSTHPVTPFLP